MNESIKSEEERLEHLKVDEENGSIFDDPIIPYKEENKPLKDIPLDGVLTEDIELVQNAANDTNVLGYVHDTDSNSTDNNHNLETESLQNGEDEEISEMQIKDSSSLQNKISEENKLKVAHCNETSTGVLELKEEEYDEEIYEESNDTFQKETKDDINMTLNDENEDLQRGSVVIQGKQPNIAASQLPCLEQLTSTKDGVMLNHFSLGCEVNGNIDRTMNFDSTGGITTDQLTSLAAMNHLAAIQAHLSTLQQMNLTLSQKIEKLEEENTQIRNLAEITIRRTRRNMGRLGELNEQVIASMTEMVELCEDLVMDGQADSMTDLNWFFEKDLVEQLVRFGTVDRELPSEFTLSHLETEIGSIEPCTPPIIKSTSWIEEGIVINFQGDNVPDIPRSPFRRFLDFFTSKRRKQIRQNRSESVNVSCSNHFSKEKEDELRNEEEMVTSL